MLSKQKLFPVYCDACGCIAATFVDNLPDGLPKSYCYKCTCSMVELMQHVNSKSFSYEKQHIVNAHFRLKSFDESGLLNKSVFIYIRNPERFKSNKPDEVTDLSDLNVKIT